MPRQKKDPSKPSLANAHHIMMCVAADESLEDLRSKYKITFTPAKQALDTIQALNPKKKVDDLKALVAELESAGGANSPRGKVGAKVGETRTFKIVNYNKTKKVRVNAAAVIPLAMFDDAQNEGASLEVKFLPGGRIEGRVVRASSAAE